MTAIPLYPSIFGAQPDVPPVPVVICWEDLGPEEYTRTLGELAKWIAWLRRTYRIPATVFPPCWYAHPGIREDLGHLWTGWLSTTHPDAGVGMIGLEWDSRREQTIARLREATAVSGCTGTRHIPEQDLPDGGDDRLWNVLIEAESRIRYRSGAFLAAVDIVADELQAAELRHEVAPEILARIAVAPASPTPAELQAVVDQIRELAMKAAAAASAGAADAVQAVVEQRDLAERERSVAAARRAVAERAARDALDEPDGPPGDVSADWIAALEELLPARVATDRAAAAAKARASAVDRRMTAGQRQPERGDLPGTAHAVPGLPPENGRRRS